MTQETQYDFKDISKKFCTLRDTIEVHLNLASKDAKDTWEDIKTSLDSPLKKINQITPQLESKKDEVELQVYLGLQELSDKFEAITPHIDKVLNKTSSKLDEAQENIDIALIKAELAKIEAEDFIEKKQKEIIDGLKTKKAQTVAKIHSVVDRASNRINEYLDRVNN